MTLRFRNYTEQAGITEDYEKVRSFFIKLGYAEYTYVRWDWMATHGGLDQSAVGKIGLWEDDNGIAGIATFDCQLGTAYCLALPEHWSLKEEILGYAERNLGGHTGFGIVIADKDISFQDIAASKGYIATEAREHDAVFYIDNTPLEYKLPDGFHITTLKENFDLYQYGCVLWKGFNHEINGEGLFSFSKKYEQTLEKEMIRPNVDLDLKIAVVAPDGSFVSYCGMWYDAQAGFAVIEPVATDPDYRRMGLGRAAVLEGIRRVSLLGAKQVYVGSSQQFYYSIGLRPYAVSTVWRKD